MVKQQATKRSSSVRKKPTAKSKSVRGMKGRRSKRPLIFGLVFALLFGIVGSYFLFTSHADTSDRGLTAYVSTSEGCWLAGRNWTSSGTCAKTCRSGTWVAGNGTYLGYCTGHVKLTLDYNYCNGIGRRFISQLGCARRYDQTNQVGARQCRYADNQYMAGGSTDYCATPCPNGSWAPYPGRPGNCTTTSTTPTPTGAPAFSVWDRDAMNYYYKSLWAAGVNVQQYWNGNISTCNAGNISDGARSAQINAINFARRANYLRPISGAYSQGATVSLQAQQAALMMDANNTLSHNPPTSWRCYTSTGATTASQSDLGLSGGAITPVNMLKSFFDEPGASNYFVGHRRWLLNPDANGFGFGMTSRASAIKVISIPTDTTNPDPLWAMWPSRGYFPSPLAPSNTQDGTDRWSVSAKSGINLAYANVSVTHNGVAVGIKREPVKNGDARSTLVWEMPLNSNSGNYSVTVSGARKSGVTQPTYTYPVYFFAPY